MSVSYKSRDRVGSGILIMDNNDSGSGSSIGNISNLETASVPKRLLHEAATTGNIELLKALLKKGKNVNRRGPGGTTPLHLAAFHDRPEAIRLLLSAGADPGVRDQDGNTPLQNAAYNGALECVRLLVKGGAEVNSRDNDGSSPLHKASFGGRIECMRYLLRKSADVNCEDEAGATPLHHAAANGLEEAVQLLLKKKARLNHKEYASGATPLHRAVSGGSLMCVKSLIEAGAEVNVQDKYGSSPLHQSCEFGYLDITEELLKCKANLNESDFSGSSPLHVAAFRGFTSHVLALCKAGADVNSGAQDVEGVPVATTSPMEKLQGNGKESTGVRATPIHHAAFSGHADCVGVLLSYGANINSRDQDGATALHKAAYQGHPSVVELLLEKVGCAVDVSDFEGATPLHKAAYSGKDKVIQLLVQKNAPLDSRDRDGGAPIHNAAYMGHIDSAKILLEAGAGIHCLSKTGATPLHMAASRGHSEMVSFLVSKGSQVDIKNAKGMTPMHVAVKSTDCLQVLAAQGAGVDVEDAKGNTPLYYALVKNCDDAISWLVLNGADINHVNSEGKSISEIAGKSAQRLLDLVHQRDEERQTKTKKEWDAAIKEFNRKPKKGVEHLIASGVIEGNPQEIANFLHKADELSKRKIGELLGENDPLSLSILDAFVEQFDFVNLTLDLALRRFLATFRLPGEAQKIDRLMERFARKYCKNNPEIFAHEDTAYLLAFALIMLNTDAHNPSIRKENKMSLSQFMRNSQGIPGASALGEALLTELYNNIVNQEIKMETDGTMFCNVEKKGWMTKQGGRIKTWKSRWFVLSGNTLYYFKKQEDREPLGIVPLENVGTRRIEAKGKKCVFEIYSLVGPDTAADIEGSSTMKGAKVKSDGIEVGHHQTYLLQTETEQEMEEWMGVISNNIFQAPINKILQQKRSASAANGSSSSVPPIRKS